ncbi:PepSY domain-containing protein [Paracoccus caeni]|uniref:PepSY domain-containing protein n=1 Tax=Paracoccus caeni TaxID=657651 RepID=UPI00190911AF|nr:PepSY domain-containing protein [Paracoccus caeni]
MIRPILTVLMLALAAPAALPAFAQQLPPEPDGTLLPHSDRFRPLPFHEIATLVGERYAGRMLAAQTRQPSPEERASGAQLVYEFRLLTPQRNLLIIRLDARTGRFLDVAGRGQIKARIRPGIGAGAVARDR